MDISIESQVGGGSGQTVYGAAVPALAVRPGQVEVPGESREDVSTHGFWKRGTNTMFDIRIVNLDTGSYLRMTPEKPFAKAEKKKKDLYLQAFLERRHTFTPMVYSTDGISRAESLAAQKILATLISYKINQEYSEMCGFVSIPASACS